jgi:hypothetical protein
MGCEATARSIKRTLQPRYIISRKAKKAEQVMASEGNNCVKYLGNLAQDFFGVWGDGMWLRLVMELERPYSMF